MARRNTDDDIDPLLYVDPELGSLAMEWHGGQGTALYALGSSAIAGNRVPQSIVEESVADLERLARRSRKKAEKRELLHLADVLGSVADGKDVRMRKGGVLDDEFSQRNPRAKNSHSPSRSADEFRSAVLQSERSAGAALGHAYGGDNVGMLNAVLESVNWLGRAAVERRYAQGSQIDPGAEATFKRLVQGQRQWASTIMSYVSGDPVAANPRRRNGAREVTEAWTLSKRRRDGGEIFYKCWKFGKGQLCGYIMHSPQRWIEVDSISGLGSTWEEHDASVKQPVLDAIWEWERTHRSVVGKDDVSTSANNPRRGKRSATRSGRARRR